MQDVDSLKRGDLLLIYRTTDGLGSANYRSVVTSVCTVNEVKIYNDFANEDEFVKYANKYSVFSENDLRYWYRYRKGFTVVKMLYNVAFTKRVIKQKLVETAGMNPNEYWGFRCVTDKQFDTTIKLGAVNERYFID